MFGNSLLLMLQMVEAGAEAALGRARKTRRMGPCAHPPPAFYPWQMRPINHGHVFLVNPASDFFLNPLLIKQPLPAEKTWHLRQKPSILANLKVTSVTGIEQPKARSSEW